MYVCLSEMNGLFAAVFLALVATTSSSCTGGPSRYHAVFADLLSYQFSDVTLDVANGLAEMRRLGSSADEAYISVDFTNKKIYRIDGNNCTVIPGPNLGPLAFGVPTNGLHLYNVTADGVELAVYQEEFQPGQERISIVDPNCVTRAFTVRSGANVLASGALYNVTVASEDAFDLSGCQ